MSYPQRQVLYPTVPPTYGVPQAPVIIQAQPVVPVQPPANKPIVDYLDKYWISTAKLPLEEGFYTGLEKFIKERKLDLNATFPNDGTRFSKIAGETILHLAVRRKDPELVKLLLKNGSDIFQKNANGETVFNIPSLSPAVLAVLLNEMETKKVSLPELAKKGVNHYRIEDIIARMPELTGYNGQAAYLKGQANSNDKFERGKLAENLFKIGDKTLRQELVTQLLNDKESWVANTVLDNLAKLPEEDKPFLSALFKTQAKSLDDSVRRKLAEMLSVKLTPWMSDTQRKELLTQLSADKNSLVYSGVLKVLSELPDEYKNYRNSQFLDLFDQTDVSRTNNAVAALLEDTKGLATDKPMLEMALDKLSKSKEPKVREQMLTSLTRSNVVDANTKGFWLHKMMSDENHQVRETVISLVCSTPNLDSAVRFGLLNELVKDKHKSVRQVMARGVCNSKYLEPALREKLLLTLASDPEEWVRYSVGTSLSNIPKEENTLRNQLLGLLSADESTLGKSNLFSLLKSESWIDEATQQKVLTNLASQPKNYFLKEIPKFVLGDKNLKPELVRDILLILAGSADSQVKDAVAKAVDAAPKLSKTIRRQIYQKLGRTDLQTGTPFPAQTMLLERTNVSAPSVDVPYRNLSRYEKSDLSRKDDTGNPIFLPKETGLTTQNNPVNVLPNYVMLQLMGQQRQWESLVDRLSPKMDANIPLTAHAKEVDGLMAKNQQLIEHLTLIRDGFKNEMPVLPDPLMPSRASVLSFDRNRYEAMKPVLDTIEHALEMAGMHQKDLTRIKSGLSTPAELKKVFTKEAVVFDDGKSKLTEPGLFREKYDVTRQSDHPFTRVAKKAVVADIGGTDSLPGVEILLDSNGQLKSKSGQRLRMVSQTADLPMLNVGLPALKSPDEVEAVVAALNLPQDKSLLLKSPQYFHALSLYQVALADLKAEIAGLSSDSPDLLARQDRYEKMEAAYKKLWAPLAKDEEEKLFAAYQELWTAQKNKNADGINAALIKLGLSARTVLRFGPREVKLKALQILLDCTEPVEGKYKDHIAGYIGLFNLNLLHPEDVSLFRDVVGTLKNWVPGQYQKRREEEINKDIESLRKLLKITE